MKNQVTQNLHQFTNVQISAQQQLTLKGGSNDSGDILITDMIAG